MKKYEILDGYRALQTDAGGNTLCRCKETEVVSRVFRNVT